MKRNIIFSLAFSLALPTLLHAQGDIKIVAADAFRTEHTANGKLKLYNEITKTVAIDQADSIVRTRYLPFYIVKQGKKGVLNSHGHVQIPIEYDHIESLSPFFTLVEKGGRKGIYNKDGVKILDTIYSDIRNEGYNWSDEGRFHVKKDGKWGICNEHGRYLAEPKYDEIKGGGLFIELLKNDSSDYLIGYKQLITGVKIAHLNFTVYDEEANNSRGFYIFQKDGKYGLLDENGTVFVPAHYTYLFNPGGSYNRNTPAWLIAQKDNKYGVIDIHDNVVLPFHYQEINTTQLWHYLVTENEDGKQFYNIKTRTFITDYTFDSFTLGYNHITIKKGGKAALVDKETMKIVFPFKYQDIQPDNTPGLLCVEKDGLYGLVDVKDKVIIPPMYESPLFLSCGDKIVIQKDGKYGIINLKNKLLYGMTSHPILAYSDYFQIFDVDKGNPKLDCNLKEIKEQ